MKPFTGSMHHSSRLWEVTGILLNTFEELEPEAIKALVEGKISNPTILIECPAFIQLGRSYHRRRLNTMTNLSKTDGRIASSG
jgi:hypothetical protein